MRLKPKEVRAYRQKLLIKQGGLCGLCAKKVPKGQDTLDHCHTSGRVRSVLHRNCNSIEGRIKHWVNRSGCDPISFLQAIVDHWQGDYEHLPYHPNHLSDSEKEIRKLKRRMHKLKTERGKQRYADRIAKLKAGL